MIVMIYFVLPDRCYLSFELVFLRFRRMLAAVIVVIVFWNVS